MLGASTSPTRQPHLLVPVSTPYSAQRSGRQFSVEGVTALLHINTATEEATARNIRRYIT